MASLTPIERRTLLMLFKDYTSFYNANSISKVLHISHVGAQKIFKRLLKENLLVSQTIGKSIIYKLNLNNNYVHQLITFLLADEANDARRWKEEFKELLDKDRIVLIFGSAIKNYAQAKDIDLMLVIDPKDIKPINHILEKKKQILPKEIHALKLTFNDLQNNLKKKDKVVIDIIKNAIVLSGQEKYVELIKDVYLF